MLHIQYSSAAQAYRLYTCLVWWQL